MFEHDTVLIPKETSWFGYYPDEAFDPVLPPQQTELYIDNGKVSYISVPGKHLGISESDAKKFVIPYLMDKASRTFSIKRHDPGGKLFITVKSPFEEHGGLQMICHHHTLTFGFSSKSAHE